MILAPNFFEREHLVSVLAALILHVLFAIALAFGIKNSSAKPPGEEKPVAVQLVMETHSAPAFTDNDPDEQDVKVNKNSVKKKTTKKVVKKWRPKVVAMGPPDPDCSLFDESSCSPCLAEPSVCAKCCSKVKKPGIAGPLTMDASATQAPCANPPCAKVDPCTPEILAEMASSFCPKVRSAIYGQLGRITLGISSDTFLSAGISVRVDSAGSVSLAAFIKSSSNQVFDNAVKSAVSKTPRVLPPSRLSSCVVSRGCVFQVTVGAAKVKKSDAVIKIDMKSEGKTPEVMK